MSDDRRPSRRRFLGGAAAGLAALAAGHTALDAARHVELTRLAVRIRDLPRALDGLRIAQLTDVHLPRNEHAADAAARLLEREAPDIVVLTGDIGEDDTAIPALDRWLPHFRGTQRTVATLGNWEHFFGLPPAVARPVYARHGITLLVDEHARLDVGGATLALVGVDDPTGGTSNLAQARAGLPPEAIEVRLLHSPALHDVWTARGEPRPALALSGHTHGGQVRVPGVPPVTPPQSGRFVSGWYDVGGAPLYVSRGVGVSRLPVRFRCAAEVPLFTLRGA